MAAETLVYEFYEKPFQYDDIDDSPYVVNRKAISVDQVSSDECRIFSMTKKWKLVERVKVMNYNGLDNYVHSLGLSSLLELSSSWVTRYRSTPRGTLVETVLEEPYWTM